MTIYPVDIKKFQYQHQGGTKSYFLTVVSASNGKGLIIKRWGKVGAAGQIKVETYDDAKALNRALSVSQRDRSNNGYKLVNKPLDSPQFEIKATSADQLRTFIGRSVYPRIGSKIIHIDPSLLTKEMREPESNQDENGNYIGNTVRTDENYIQSVKEVEEEKRRAELEQANQHYNSNPLFGRF